MHQMMKYEGRNCLQKKSEGCNLKSAYIHRTFTYWNESDKCESHTRCKM